MTYSIELNGYEEADHWKAINEKDVYLSYTGDFAPHNMGHMHMSCEMLLVEQGGADYVIDGSRYTLEPRSLLIIGSMDLHRRTLTDLPFIRYGLTLMPGFLESLPIVNEHLGVFKSPSPEVFAKLAPLPDQVFDEVREIFLALGEETISVRPGTSSMVYAHLVRLAVILSRLLNSDPVAPLLTPAYTSVAEIREYIDSNFAEPLSLESLSEKFFMSQATISRRFAARFGTNISNYICSVRITSASRLLETTNGSVTEIAARVGFHSVNTFIRQFRDKIGVTPLQYRKQYEQHLHAREMRHMA